MNQLLLALLILSMPFSTVSASEFVGAGARTCDDYIRAPASDNVGYISWAQGYLSGFNMMYSLTTRSIKELPNHQSIKGSLDAICSANPSKAIHEGLSHLFMDLPAGRPL